MSDVFQHIRNRRLLAARRYANTVGRFAASEQTTKEKIPGAVLDTLDRTEEDFRLDIKSKRERLKLADELRDQRKLLVKTKKIAQVLQKDQVAIAETREELEQRIAGIEQRLGGH